MNKFGTGDWAIAELSSVSFPNVRATAYRSNNFILYDNEKLVQTFIKYIPN